MAVIYTPHFVQFFNDDGAPLAGGKLYTYAAGTTTPKATYTTAAGTVENANPVVLDSAGRATLFISGSYKFSLYTSADVLVRTTDNITAFTATGEASDAFYQTFSGDGSTTGFTLSESLGTDEKTIMVFVDNSNRNHVANGTFATDTIWTKGSGWTIGSGVATASGAISTAIEQTAAFTVEEGVAYIVTMTITRSAGSLTTSIGGTAGTARSSSGTYSEIIIAGSTQTIAFTGAGFTGTLDTVTVELANGKGFEIQPTTAYTVSGTSLTISSAPASGTNNIMVWAPARLANAASASAAAADASATQAAASATLAGTYAGYNYKYDTDTTASDPGAGFFRLNNATIASATALYISETTDDSQSISGDLATWDDSTSTIRGRLRIYKVGTPSTFALFNITGSITDNGTWNTFTVAYVTGSGTFADNDETALQFIRNGDKGDTGAQGPTGSISDLSGVSTAVVTASDFIIFQDVSDSNNTRKDEVQGILDLIPNNAGMVLLTTASASNSATVDFTTNINSTYDEYIISFTDVVVQTDVVNLLFRTSTDGGSSFGTSYHSAHIRVDAGAVSGGNATFTTDTGASALVLAAAIGNAADESCSGHMRMFVPSGTVRKKLFTWHTVHTDSSGEANFATGGGLQNSTSDIDAIRFLASSGNIVSGTFRLYGVKKS